MLYDSDASFLKIKSQIKAELIDHYDAVKSSIDMRAQTMLCKSSLEESSKQQILDVNKKMIDQVDSIYEKNNDLITKYFAENTKDSCSLTKEEIKHKILDSYCTYVSKEFLIREIKRKNPMGVLVLSNWYLDQNQLNFIKLKLSNECKEENLIKCFMDENVFLLSHVLEKKMLQERNITNLITLNKESIIKSLENVQTYSIDFKKELKCIDSINKNALTLLENCESFNIVKFKPIDNDAFSNNGKAKKIGLSCLSSSEEIEGILAKIAHMKSIESLTITKSDSQVFLTDKLSTLENLNQIILLTNQIDIIKNSTFKGISNLERLMLGYNKIRLIETKAFQDLTKMISLCLACNLIESINVNLFRNLTNLESLELSSNHITKLKNSTFSSLTNLKYLNLSNNRLTKIFELNFEGLGKLERLYLSGNILTELNSMNVFRQLKNLKKLDLSDNPLISINNRIFNCLTKLEYLKITSNSELEVLGKKLLGRGINQLIKLNLSDCSISRIQPTSFINFSNLKILNLSENSIDILKGNMFNGLSQLAELDLRCCQITELEEDAFKSLENLDTLHFQSNSIGVWDLSSKYFGALISLRNLDISECDIVKVKVAEVKDGDGSIGLKKLEFLDISDNPILDSDESDDNEEKEQSENSMSDSDDDDKKEFKKKEITKNELISKFKTQYGMEALKNIIIDGISVGIKRAYKYDDSDPSDSDDDYLSDADDAKNDESDSGSKSSSSSNQELKLIASDEKLKIEKKDDCMLLERSWRSVYESDESDSYDPDDDDDDDDYSDDDDGGFFFSNDDDDEYYITTDDEGDEYYAYRNMFDNTYDDDDRNVYRNMERCVQQ